MLNVIVRYAAPEAKYWLITKHNVFIQDEENKNYKTS